LSNDSSADVRVLCVAVEVLFIVFHPPRLLVWLLLEDGGAADVVVVVVVEEEEEETPMDEIPCVWNEPNTLPRAVLLLEDSRDS